MKNKKILITLRRVILALFLLFITYESYMHIELGGGTTGSPSIHALCPYGGLESLYALFITGEFVKKIFTGTLVLFIITIILAILFRRSFCGFICPFGAIQEFFGMIGRKVFGKQYTLPKRFDQPLRYLKYVVLIITALGAFITGTLWMSPYDPWAAYAHIFEGLDSLISESLIGLILLVITVIGSLIYDRFFCKYLCPMGAFLGIVSKVSPQKITRNDHTCINCGICNKVCPVNIEVDQADDITSAECLNCQNCTLSCPKEGALTVSYGKKKSLVPVTIMLAIFILYFGGVYTAKTVDALNFLPEPIPVGEIMNIEDIKGYMTLEEVSQYIGMSLEEVYETLQLPNDTPHNTQMKELSNYVPELDMHGAKELLGGGEILEEHEEEK